MISMRVDVVLRRRCSVERTDAAESTGSRDGRQSGMTAALPVRCYCRRQRRPLSDLTAAVATPTEFSLKLLKSINRFDFIRRASIRHQDWVAEAGRRRRRWWCAARDRARHSCDGRAVDSLEVHGRRSTGHYTIY